MFIIDEDPTIEFSKEQLIQILQVWRMFLVSLGKTENSIRISDETLVLYDKAFEAGSKEIPFLNEEGEDLTDVALIDRMLIMKALKAHGYDPRHDDSMLAYQVGFFACLTQPEDCRWKVDG